MSVVHPACDPQHTRFTALICVISHHNWGKLRSGAPRDKTCCVGYHIPSVRNFHATNALGHRCPFLSHGVGSAHGLHLGTLKKWAVLGLRHSKWT